MLKMNWIFPFCERNTTKLTSTLNETMLKTESIIPFWCSHRRWKNHTKRAQCFLLLFGVFDKHGKVLCIDKFPQFFHRIFFERFTCSGWIVEYSWLLHVFQCMIKCWIWIAQRWHLYTADKEQNKYSAKSAHNFFCSRSI